MSKDNSFLFDIFHSCVLIQEFTAEIDLNTFQADVMRQDAIIRRIEIIGEAASNLSSEFKELNSEIP